MAVTESADRSTKHGRASAAWLAAAGTLVLMPLLFFLLRRGLSDGDNAALVFAAALCIPLAAAAYILFVLTFRRR